MNTDSRIVVVGCGGTGGFVAEGLCRLLIGSDIDITLIDHDRVEPPNLNRQHFFAADLDKFKSQVMAERLARRYGRRIGYSVYPFMPDMVKENLGGGMYSVLSGSLVIGCVDNPEARRQIGDSIRFGNWWLDAGNGRSSGQVLLGNALSVEYMYGAFDDVSKEAHRLPMPSLQLPSLLAPVTVDTERPRDCAEAVQEEEQGPVINQAMATLVLQFVHKFMKGELTWMGAYIDLDAGTLQTVPAEPEIVARMLGVKVDTLKERGCHIGRLSRIR